MRSLIKVVASTVFLLIAAIFLISCSIAQKTESTSFGALGSALGAALGGVAGMAIGTNASSILESLFEFPWPPPRASAFVRIPTNKLLPGGPKVFSLREAAARLELAFMEVGYAEWSYYSVPNGFALVSRMERIRADGTPKEGQDRWSVSTLHSKITSLRDYIDALFKAPQGHYRVIVFVVTDQPFVQSENEMTSGKAKNLISGGAMQLSSPIAEKSCDEKYYTTALIYEFERGAGEKEAALRLPSDLQGKTHLERAGLWSQLGGN